jgi:hypothetical protein
MRCHGFRVIWFGDFLAFSGAVFFCVDFSSSSNAVVNLVVIEGE